MNLPKYLQMFGGVIYVGIRYIFSTKFSFLSFINQHYFTT